MTLVVDLWLAVLASCWLPLAAWAAVDARRRYHRRRAVAASAVVALALPYVGVVVHLLVRPRRLSERREAEIRARFLRRLAPPELPPAVPADERVPVAPAVAEPAAAT